jgi:RNA polymerase sigma factor (sigma-70 family)
VPGSGGSIFVADRPGENLVSGPDRSGLRAGDPLRSPESQTAQFARQDALHARGVPGSPSPARAYKVDHDAGTSSPARVPAHIPIPDVAAPPSGQVVAAPAAAQTNAAAAPSEQVAGVEAAPSRAGFSQAPGDVPDGSLLQRYVVHREEMAFSALVQRHERLVFGVCRRVLGDSHAAQDAFQATFLVLARKAGMLDRDSPLAGWLYKVAYHLALRLRALADRQRRREKEAAYGRTEETASESVADLERQEMREALRDELQRLPEEYRMPLVLCYFDGRTHEEAARVIGLPRGSMAKRIGEGLERLRERLTDRGFML